MNVFLKTAYTDKGNKYTKSNIAKTTGALALGGLYAGTVIPALKKIDLSQITEQVVDTYNEAAPEVADSVKATMKNADIAGLVKKGTRLGLGVGIAMTAAIGLGIGAIVDGIINKVAKSKANASAIKAE